MKKLLFLFSLCAVSHCYAGSSPQAAPDTNTTGEIARGGEREGPQGNQNEQERRGAMSQEMQTQKQNQERQQNQPPIGS